MRKIAIARRNGLGDLLCTFPLISYLKKEDPETQITLFVDESNAPLLPYLPPVNEVVVFDKKKNKYVHLIKIGCSFRKKKFDVAISAKTSPMKLMNYFLYSLGAKRRIAYVGDHWSRRLINCPVRFDPLTHRDKHQALKVLKLVAPHLQSVPRELYPKITSPFSQSQEKIVLLSASTTRASSRLDLTRYAALVNRLYKEEGPFIVRILSLPADAIRAKALAAEMEVPCSVHAPRTFEEFMRIIGEGGLFFGGDGGTAHIAAAMGKPAVVLFGETRPVEWAPLGEYVETLYDPVHVNRLSDSMIFEAMKHRIQDVRRNGC